MTLEVDANGMWVEVKPSCQKFVDFVAMRQIETEEQSGKMTSDMEVRTKQRRVTEFLHAEKALTDIH
jgi:hypothetical protein